MEVVLQAEGLRKRYRGVLAVDGIDLQVRAGARVALLGPNGAGKTTTLMMLLGVITPDEGWVEILGHRLPRGRTAALADVGFAAGYLPLAERMRVREFLRMYGQLYGIAEPGPLIESSVPIALERCPMPKRSSELSISGPGSAMP